MNVPATLWQVSFKHSNHSKELWSLEVGHTNTNLWTPFERFHLCYDQECDEIYSVFMPYVCESGTILKQCYFRDEQRATHRRAVIMCCYIFILKVRILCTVWFVRNHNRRRLFLEVFLNGLVWRWRVEWRENGTNAVWVFVLCVNAAFTDWTYQNIEETKYLFSATGNKIKPQQ